MLTRERSASSAFFSTATPASDVLAPASPEASGAWTVAAAFAVTTGMAGAWTARWGSLNLGGATLDNEDYYLIKKRFTAMGAIQIENQARI
jgi:hypothetical protein